MKPDERWDANYAKLQAFHTKHGHCKVPSSRNGLGLWVSRQRVRKANPRPQHGIPPLTQDQLDRLNALGFVWQREKDQKWMEMFERLKEYRRLNGDCCVPNTYKEDPKLATWVTQQRTMNTQGKIRADRKEKLNSIGFSWVLGTGWRPGGTLDLSASVTREVPESRHSEVLKNRVQRQWSDSFDRLVEFNKAHGHWRVPSSYEKDTSLASWIETQRSSRDSLDPQQVERLDSIGFPWNNDDDMEETDEGGGMDAEYQTADDFSDYETANESLDDDDDDDDDDKSLDDAKMSARKKQEPPVGNEDEDDDDESLNDNAKTSARRKQNLEAARSKEDLEQHWTNMFERLKQYRRRNGDCLVRQRYKKDPQLGAWVTELRRYNNKGILRRDRKEKLNSIGFPWALTTSRRPAVKRSNVEASRKRSRSDATSTAEDDSRVHSSSKHHKRLRGQDASTPSRYEVGTKVKKFVKGLGWYSGEVTSYDGTHYQVSYEDGDLEEHNEQSLARFVLSPNLASVDIDTRVAVKWPSNGKYYEATVVRESNEERPFCLVYDSGEYEWVDLRERKFRLLGEGTRILDATTNAARIKTIEIGSRVAVLWPDDDTYYGATVIKKRNRKEGFCLEYDDLETEWIDLVKRKFRVLKGESS